MSEPLPVAAFDIDDHTRVLIQTTPVIAPAKPTGEALSSPNATSPVWLNRR